MRWFASDLTSLSIVCCFLKGRVTVQVACISSKILDFWATDVIHRTSVPRTLGLPRSQNAGCIYIFLIMPCTHDWLPNPMSVMSLAFRVLELLCQRCTGDCTDWAWAMWLPYAWQMFCTSSRGNRFYILMENSITNTCHVGCNDCLWQGAGAKPWAPAPHTTSLC